MAFPGCRHGRRYFPSFAMLTDNVKTHDQRSAPIYIRENRLNNARLTRERRRFGFNGKECGSRQYFLASLAILEKDSSGDGEAKRKEDK